MFQARFVVLAALFHAFVVVSVTFLVAFLADPVTFGIFHCDSHDEVDFDVAPTSDFVVDEANGPHDHPVVSARATLPK